MSTFAVLEADKPEDLERWMDVLSNAAVRRPHDEPRYLKLMGRPGWRDLCALYEGREGCVVYPFHLADLDESVFGDPARGRSVCISPYGYGGPLKARGRLTEDEAREFERHLVEALAARRVVTEFVREDLFQSRLVERSAGERVQVSSNVAVPLAGDDKTRWALYEHKVRKNVKRAVSEGVEIRFGDAAESLDAFHRVYVSTMQRTGADAAFLIESSEFEAYMRSDTPECSTMIVLALHDGRSVSAEMVLVGSHEAYSFLGGTLPESFPLRPNDLLKHETIKWCASRGLDHYVLGGGLEGGDGIFRYKRSFAPDGVLPFWTRRVVHDPVAHDELVEARRARAPEGWQPREGFFPAFMS